MARPVQHGYSNEDAVAFRVRSNGPHTVKWKANSYRWVAGEQHLLYEDLPIVGGTLSMDSSDPIRRHLTLEVAGVGRLVPDSPNNPLAPFGQYLKLWVTIDRQGGGWFNWMTMGEFPIQTTSSEWPSMIQTVEAADWSAVVDDYLHIHKRSYNKKTIHDALKEITEAALPDRVFSIHSEDEAKSTNVEPNSIAEAASSRWETAVEIAQARGYEAFFDCFGNLIIRHDITKDDNETVPSVGPDIGTVTFPICTIKDGERANLVALTSSVTREGGCNGVFINLHETASQSLRREGRPVAGDKRVNKTVQALGDGPIAWGDRYGRQPVVIERPVKVITDDVVERQQRRANRILNRRGGVVRTIDMDIVGQYWLEADDRIEVQYDGRTEYHYVASIERDISGESPARIRTRSLSVEDPG